MNTQDIPGGNTEVNQQILLDLTQRYHDDAVEYIFT
jgi:hypothetical protein